MAPQTTKGAKSQRAPISTQAPLDVKANYYN